MAETGKKGDWEEEGIEEEGTNTTQQQEDINRGIRCVFHLFLTPPSSLSCCITKGYEKFNLLDLPLPVLRSFGERRWRTRWIREGRRENNTDNRESPFSWLHWHHLLKRGCQFCFLLILPLVSSLSLPHPPPPPSCITSTHVFSLSNFILSRLRCVFFSNWSPHPFIDAKSEVYSLIRVFGIQWISYCVSSSSSLFLSWEGMRIQKETMIPVKVKFLPLVSHDNLVFPSNSCLDTCLVCFFPSSPSLLSLSNELFLWSDGFVFLDQITMSLLNVCSFSFLDWR